MLDLPAFVHIEPVSYRWVRSFDQNLYCNGKAMDPPGSDRPLASVGHRIIRCWLFFGQR